uniref:Saposin B-type domain-containing protein n=1 Tax=Rhabditophanes sp. KR3021 TaxID=114890 RepID=A0AC35TGT4_9BILA
MKFLAVFISLFLLASTVSAGFKCTLCLDAVKELEAYMAANEGSADGAAEWVCKKITGGISILESLCDELFDTEIDHLVKGIQANDPPQKICSEVR